MKVNYSVCQEPSVGKFLYAYQEWLEHKDKTPGLQEINTRIENEQIT
jgi:hypothetical protein